jgi:hypothetical protein
MRLSPASRILLGLGGLSLVAGLSANATLGDAPAPPSDLPGPLSPSQLDAPAAPSTRSVALPSDPSLPRTADGRHYPLIPRDPDSLALLLVTVEEALRNEATPAVDLPALGHQQQVIYRVLSHRRELAEQVRQRLPEPWQWVADRHLEARRAFLTMHRAHKRATVLPAWRIIAPEPAENLLRYYREAEAATGIAWQVLAAVNLVETGMGRIDGVSVANAQGPMQFLPTTWAEPGIGKGDIRDPEDAIHAAARYLVRRGGLKDIRKGLWGYNNSDYYGTAVLAYAELLRRDPAAYTGLYHWEIHFASAAGDLWLPVGYDQNEPVAVTTYLERSPVSAPPADLSPAAATTGWSPAAAGSGSTAATTPPEAP